MLIFVVVILAADVLDFHSLNGINPSQIVTLSGNDQLIPGTTTFRQLEVTETLQVIIYLSFKTAIGEMFKFFEY